MSTAESKPVVFKTKLEELEDRVLLSAAVEAPAAMGSDALLDSQTPQAVASPGETTDQPAPSVLAAPLSEGVAASPLEGAAYVANDPIGVARGVYPGRVAWVRDADATSWDGSTGRWWWDSNTDPAVVANMLSDSIQWLSGQTSDAAAWDALFRYHNLANTGVDVGYTPGQKIAIKANFNVDSSQTYSGNLSSTSPQLLKALVAQLVDVAGVTEGDITITDPSRCVPDKVFDYIRAVYPNVKFVDEIGGNGRIQVQADTSVMVHYSDLDSARDTYLPTVLTQADYQINVANLKRHNYAGVTLTAKNHFGSIQKQSNGDWKPDELHAYVDTRPHGSPNPMGSYNPLVDINGHEHLGGKTFLYLIDGLYGAYHQGANPSKWTTFGNDWPSSLFASQDQVAIDSVAYDFLRNEWDIFANADNYLHEAAEADSPASGTFYDPEEDGTRLASQGVHEHWNNATDRQYTRNLGTGDGIELVSTEPISDVTSPTVVATERNGGADLPAALNSYAVTFSEDVGASIGVDDLTVFNDTTGMPVETSGAGVAWDAGSLTATWDLSALDLPAGRYTLSMVASGIEDAAGNPLDGDGDGTGGDDYSESMMVALEGDLNLDGQVSFHEAAVAVANIGLTGAGWADGDGDGNGTVEVGDAQAAVGNYGQVLSAQVSPAIAAPMYVSHSTIERDGVDWSWLDPDSEEEGDLLSMEVPV